jgi:hypothetical protein
MLWDGNGIIIVDPKDLVFKSVDIVRTNEYYSNHRAISK